MRTSLSGSAGGSGHTRDQQRRRRTHRTHEIVAVDSSGFRDHCGRTRETPPLNGERRLRPVVPLETVDLGVWSHAPPLSARKPQWRRTCRMIARNCVRMTVGRERRWRSPGAGLAPWSATVTLTTGLTSVCMTSALISAVAFWRPAGYQVLARRLVVALDLGVGPCSSHVGPTTVRGTVSQQRRETDGQIGLLLASVAAVAGYVAHRCCYRPSTRAVG